MDYGAAILAVNITEMLLLLKIAYGEDVSMRAPSIVRDTTRKYALTLKRIHNLGDVKPVPAVPPALEVSFAAALLDLYKLYLDKNLSYLDIKLTEGEWVLTGDWKKVGGANPQQFRDLLDKWGTEHIVERSNPNAKRSTWILSRGWISKLKMKLPHPAPSTSTPKQAEKTGEK